MFTVAGVADKPDWFPGPAHSNDFLSVRDCKGELKDKLRGWIPQNFSMSEISSGHNFFSYEAHIRDSQMIKTNKEHKENIVL